MQLIGPDEIQNLADWLPDPIHEPAESTIRSASRGMIEAGFFPLPDFAYRFLRVYRDRITASRILDPCARVGVLLSALVHDSSEPIEGIGLVNGAERQTVVADIVRDLPISILNAESVAKSGLEPADLIASAPPFQSEEECGSVRINGQATRIKETKPIRFILQSAQYLKEKGRLIFLVPPKFFRKKNNGWQNMKELGVYPRAVISLPPGSFVGTSMSGSLVIAGRQPVEDLFVARLSDADQIEPIIQNLFQRKNGRKRELGQLLDKGEFVSWEALELDHEIQQLSAWSGMEAVRFGDVILEVNTVRYGEEFEAADVRETSDENGKMESETLYLPRYGSEREVGMRVEDLEGEHREYLELVADPRRTSSEFLAQVLESDLGQKLRARWAGGRDRGAISSSDLKDKTIYLPTLDTQEHVLRTHREIKDLQTELNELQARLWSRPLSVEDVERDVQRINQDESLENWIKTIPFPLASVLRRYRASERLEHKQGFLRDFFEALAQFLATTMLSAFHNDKSIFQDRKSYWLGADEGYRESLKRSTFGNWTEIATRLAKDTRRMLSTNREHCLELYRANSPRWIKSISDKRVYRALKEVVEYRNDWKGHSGTTTRAQIFRKRIRQLKDQLAEVRNAFGFAFDELYLLKPGMTEFRGGVCYTRVKQLKGPQTIFEEATVETTVPMDMDRLHLLEEGGSRSLKLLPFFQLRPSPRSDQNACYFYNRLEGDGKARWVSYHFEGIAEDDKNPTIESPEVVAVLNELIGED